MKIKKHILGVLVLLGIVNVACDKQKTETVQISEYTIKAQQTLDSLYKYYGIEDSNLLRETYPFDDAYQASYLDSNSEQNQANLYSYLWPFRGLYQLSIL